MFYILLAIFAAAIFGICFLIDRLCRRLFPKDGRKAVTMPRRTAVFGILLTALGFAALFLFWSQLTVFFRIAAALVLGLGIFLLVQYFSFSIRYDSQGFTFRTLGKRPLTAQYGDILGQTSLLTRSGVNSSLHLKDGEVPIFSAQVGAKEFLKTAFAAWCELKEIDPDTVENNPDYLVYFPEP